MNNDRLPIDLPPAVGPVHGPDIGSLSSGARRTLWQRQQIARGRHPATAMPLRTPEGETCGTCVHSRLRDRWWKCRLVTETGGPGTDIRVSWPACTRWEER